ncbi:YdcH family protein [Arenibacterium sp. LLYu02]|uniref:YdcH family protein n=1 Tax=Arenibacterium sp. LLYu02 TaxID=3404132 RepID=UPI003B220CEB
MNERSDLSMANEDVLRVELEVFKREHRDLDEAIHALEEKGTADALTLRRLKKQKLLLKDKIALIEDRLLPDIIA